MQRARKVELAAHRPLGDLRDLRLDPGIVGQFVDAFDGDHGGIHVCDQQLLFPPLGQLDDHIHPVANAGQRGAGGNGIKPKENIRRLALVQPVVIHRRATRYGQPPGRFGNIFLTQGATCH